MAIFKKNAFSCAFLLFLSLFSGSLSVQNQRSIDTIYNGCGTTKGCFGNTDECVGQQDCTEMVTHHVMGDRVHFELLVLPREDGDNPQYVASALSADQRMGDDSVVECVWENDGGHAYAAWLTASARNSVRENVPQDIVQLIEFSNTNGALYCRVEKQADHTIFANNFNVLTTTYYLMIASGTNLREDGDGIARHNLLRRVSSNPVNFTQLETEEVDDSIYLGCGVSKTCFGFPNLCVNSRSCDYIATFYINVDRIHYEMQSVIGSPRYVASGLSTDNQMGDDSVTECVFQNGHVHAFASYTTPRDSTGLNAVRDGVDQSIVSLMRGVYSDGKIYCKVAKDVAVTLNGMNFDVNGRLYHFMVATGSDIEDDGITYHNIGRMISDQPLNFTHIGDSVELAPRSVLIMIHASFMIVAWIGTGAVGTLLARYFKSTWVGQQINGKDLWFSWHVLLMSTTWALHIAAIITIFVYVYGWMPGDATHAIVGIVATVFVFFQPIGGLFRPGVKDDYRWLFNVLHWFGGVIAQIMAVIAMFFAVTLQRAQLPELFYWILTGFVVSTLCAHGILSTSSWILMRKSGGRKNSVTIDADNKLILKEDSHALFRKLILTLYVMIAFGCTVTLIVLATT